MESRMMNHLIDSRKNIYQISVLSQGLFICEVQTQFTHREHINMLEIIQECYLWCIYRISS